ncbi:MAG: LysM peptidoglycan-binding domain-containing protein [Solirubrobacteraceae bacterium]
MTAAPLARTISATPAPEPLPASPASASASDHAEPADRTHTIHPGESLWSIAGDLLGESATPTQIAREVHRLWEINEDVIATGDPNLLMIGTRLRLR